MSSFEKWLECNAVRDVAADELVLPLSDLMALLDEYVVVPRKPTQNMIHAGRCARKTLSTVVQTYEVMVEAGENEQNTM